MDGHALSSNVVISSSDIVGQFGGGSCVGYLYSDGSCSNPSVTSSSGWILAPVTINSQATATVNNDTTETVSGCSGGTKYYGSCQGVACSPTNSTAYSTGVLVTPDVSTHASFLSRCYSTGYESSVVTRSDLTFSAATPTHTPDTGSYSSTQSVTIADTTTGSPTLKYCTDGTNTCDPTSGTTYSTPVSVASTEYLRSIGEKTNYNNSSVKSSLYSIGGGASFTLVQHVMVTGAACGSGTITSCTIPVAATGAGHVGVVAAMLYGGTAHSITSVSGGGTYTHCTACTALQNSANTDISYTLNTASGATSVVVNFTGTGYNGATVEYLELSFAGSSVAFDSSTTNSILDTGSVTSQPGVSLAGISGTQDVLIQILDTSIAANITAITTPYTLEDVGNPGLGPRAGVGVALNSIATSAPTWTLGAGSQAAGSAIAILVNP